MIFTLAERLNEMLDRLQCVLYPRLVACKWFSRVETSPFYGLLPEGVGGHNTRACPC